MKEWDIIKNTSIKTIYLPLFSLTYFSLPHTHSLVNVSKVGPPNWKWQLNKSRYSFENTFAFSSRREPQFTKPSKILFEKESTVHLNHAQGTPSMMKVMLLLPSPNELLLLNTDKSSWIVSLCMMHPDQISYLLVAISLIRICSIR